VPGAGQLDDDLAAVANRLLWRLVLGVAFVNNQFEGYAPETARWLVALADAATSA
jgi:hypothetical protein